ncbi:MAG: hypothetical protein Q4G25_08100 [Paracoccus sp. (in: a-proteobacteria)]|nr:hypothetical protein [Paracoccus sp. (in: a-proteobacteria)]
MHRIVMPAALCVMLAPVALADGLDFLDERVFTPPGACGLIASPAADVDVDADGAGGHILYGRDGVRGFLATDYPGICRLGRVIDDGLPGRGNGWPTVMTTLSCIDDVAVPSFDILVLEYEPAGDHGAARVHVYPLDGREEAAGGIADTYQECDGSAAEWLDGAP